MFLFGAMQGEGVRPGSPGAFLWHTVAPLVGFSAPVFIAWGLIRARRLRRRGWYARSLAAHALPLMPFAAAVAMLLIAPPG